MGANMLAVVLHEPTETRSTPLQDSETIELAALVIASEVWFPAVQAAHERGDLAALEQVWETLSWNSDYELPEADPSEDDPIVERLRPYKNTVADMICSAINYGPDDCYEWTTIPTQAGGKLHITGGVAWGDDPTEAFRYWNDLFMVDVDDAIYNALGYTDI